VSHDLRAPLRSIDGFSQCCWKLRPAARPGGAGFPAAGARASQRMGTLIDDLLKLARVTRAEMRSEVVD